MRESTTTKVCSRLLRFRIALLPAVLAVLTFLAVLAAPFFPGPDAADARDVAMSTQHLARVELGRRLFFEPLASPSGKRSCASCHDPEHGFSDPKRVSVDDFGMTRRHSQAILDSAHNPTAHWDGEFADIEELVKARLTATPMTGSYGRGGPPTTPSALTQTQMDRMGKHLARMFEKAAAAQENAPDGDSKEGDEDIEKTTVDLMADFLRAFSGTRSFEGLTGSEKAVPDQLMSSARYDEAFSKAFGSKQINLDRIADALSAYCKTIVSTESPFDRHRAGGDTALSESAQRGLALFEGRAGCADCHVIEGERARFTDYAFHNTGVAWDDVSKGRFDGSQAVLASILENSDLKKRLEKMRAGGQAQLAQMFSDAGRGGVSKKSAETRSFKTPTLRDVAKRGPYMHNGRFETLAQVVRYYAEGCGNDPEKDERLQPFEASERDIQDLVAFLGTLSGDERPGLAKTAWSRRAKATKLRFVDHAGEPLRGIPVGVQPAGDAIPVQNAKGGAAELETDEEGWVRYRVPPTTHARLLLAEGLVPTGGEMVPDTCREATVQLPVKGRMKFVVVFPQGTGAPVAIRAEHPAPSIQIASGFRSRLGRKPNVGGDNDDGSGNGNFRLGVVNFSGMPGGPTEPTRFLRTELKTVEGRAIATYEGWVRSDVQPQATLVVPLPRSGQAEAHKREVTLTRDGVVKFAVGK